MTCVVADYFNAQSSAGRAVPVSALTGFYSTAKYAQLLLEASFNASSASSALIAVAGTLTFMNSADCSAAPSALCASLHREVCDIYGGLCGPCLPGYAGLDGYANTACYAVHSPVVGVGYPCSKQSAAQCVTGWCLNGTCSDLLKPCEGNCSSRGRCSYVDSNGTPLPACFATDATCFAKCVCESTFFGRDCSIQTEPYRDRWIALRNATCNALVRALSLEDMSADAVLSRAAAVRDLFLDPSQVSLGTLQACSAVLFDAVMTYPSLCCQVIFICSLVPTPLTR